MKRGDKVYLYGTVPGIVCKDTKEDDTKVKLTNPGVFNIADEEQYSDYFSIKDVSYERL